jgi:hypothetical protein
MSSFKVIDRRRIPSPDDDRVGQFDTIIIYKLSDLEVHPVRIPKDNVTEADIVEAVRADIEATKRFVGQEFQL